LTLPLPFTTKHLPTHRTLTAHQRAGDALLRILPAELPEPLSHSATADYAATRAGEPYQLCTVYAIRHSLPTTTTVYHHLSSAHVRPHALPRTGHNTNVALRIHSDVQTIKVSRVCFGGFGLRQLITTCMLPLTLFLNNCRRPCDIQRQFSPVNHTHSQLACPRPSIPHCVLRRGLNIPRALRLSRVDADWRTWPRV